mmetsp:Transcript_42193/g.100030  ORF Transcript_42193/g.100030 Transcript_42193/m.100030 type:complete len:227 (+) Transcript_42193:25-705(+)
MAAAGYGSLPPLGEARVGSMRRTAVAVAAASALCLVVVALVGFGAAQPSVMPVMQYTTTTTAACGCCGIVGCYCGCPAPAWGQAYGSSQLSNVPTIGTQAAVTPDWTDVITALTRETSEDTAEIASLTGKVARLETFKAQTIPRLKYLTHIQKYMREHQARQERGDDLANGGSDAAYDPFPGNTEEAELATYGLGTEAGGPPIEVAPGAAATKARRVTLAGVAAKK